MTDTELTPEPVAIVGLACRVPGAADANRFWENLVAGVEARTALTTEQMLAAGAAEQEVDQDNWVAAAFLLDHAADFDATVFGMTPREAAVADPQHRLFLELSHTALEDAGIDPRRVDGDIGVYGGRGTERYRWEKVARNRSILATTPPMALGAGNLSDNVTTFVSYKLGLRGPSVGVYTACSTSLVAVHMACEALRAGEADVMLAGGVSMEFDQERGYPHVEGGVESADGHVRPFDANATGTMWGSGGAVVVLKRLEEARADGDTVRAVVLGNAINNDGSAKVGFTAPSVDGQTAAVGHALAVAGVDPRTIGYVEAHGTATALGDPIEVAALTSVYSRGTDETGWCGIGSVKSNIGHLSQGAGVVGLIKVVLALEHGLMPPSLNFDAPNPRIDFDASPFYVNTSLAKWEPTGARPRRAAVSSFGIGGTNAHVVVEEAPEPPLEDTAADRLTGPVLLRVSARDTTGLAQAAEQLADRLESEPQPGLADVAHTLRVGRAQHPHRAFAVADNPADATSILRDPRRRQPSVAASTAPRVALLLTGQGAQYGGMGAALYEHEPVFAAALDECDSLLDIDLRRSGSRREVDIRGAMFATGAPADAALAQTAMTQPALFCLEYALAQLWLSWGLSPTAMLGHSIGEWVAATLAGVFELPDALRLVTTRGRLMESMPAGAMLAVTADESEIAPTLPRGPIAIATVNGPGTCVVSGPTEVIEAFAAGLPDHIKGKRLRTSHAFHSPMMDPVLEDFRLAVSEVPRRPPHTPFLSDITGEPVTDDQAVDPEYWADQLRQPVRFGAGVARLLADGPTAFVECGPGRQLTGLARMQTRGQGPPVVHSLPGATDRQGDVETLYTAAGRLWAAGVSVDPPTAGRRVPLPGYPYQRTRHWVDPDDLADAAVSASSTTGQAGTPADEARLPLESWFAVPSWRQLTPSAPGPVEGLWLVFTADPIGDRLAEELDEAGARVITVAPGPAYSQPVPGHGHGHRVVDATSAADYTALVADLPERPARIVHAWALAGDPAGVDVDAAWRAQDLGLFSLVHLLKALEDPDVQIDVVTVGTQHVLGSDVTRPEQATVAGIVRSAPLELPGLRMRHIDLAGDEARQQVLAAVTRPLDEMTIALRDGRLWTAGYAHVTVPPAASATQGALLAPGRSDQGVYLITGGLGGLGLAIAEALASSTREPTLVLTSRHGLPPREQWDQLIHGTDRVAQAVRSVRGIERAGGRVLPVALAADDIEGLRALRRGLRTELGRVAGIIHAAGIPGAGLLATRDLADMHAVVAPKLAGALALEAVFGDDELDFVVLFSSITGTVGGFGESDYCAANAFLDAYAQARQRWRVPVRSLGWAGWTGAGMLAEVLARGTTVDEVDHPLITELRRAVDGTASGRAVISPRTQWVLDEHRIGGDAVLPGTAQLEMMRATVVAAMEAPSGDHVLELSDVLFIAPLRVADDQFADIEIIVREQEVTLVHEGTVYARATAEWVLPNPAEPLDLQARLARATSRPDLAERERRASGLVSFGRHWSNVREVWLSDTDQLNRLEVPETEQADLAGWVLPPALLDQATFVVSGIGGSSLPMGYGRVVIRAPLPARCWAHRRQAEQPEGNDRSLRGGDILTDSFTVLDDDGRPLVEVTDFMMRRLYSVPSTLQPGSGAVSPRGEGPQGPGEGWIAPSEGVEAFRRAVGADLGGHVVITPRPISQVADRVRRGAEPTGGETASDTPTSEDGTTSALVAAIFSAVLGVAEVGDDDDFFDLGGNSLVAVQLIGHIRETAGVRVPLRMLFDTSTVAGIAARIDELRRQLARSPVDDGQDEPDVIPRLPR